MQAQIELRHAISDDDFAQVRALAERYGAWDVDLTTRLGIPAEDLLSFQHDYRVEALRARYGGPPSIMLLVRDEPPRIYRRAKLSENCPLWNRHKRRRPRSRIHLSSASVRFGWRWNTAMSIRVKLQR